MMGILAVDLSSAYSPLVGTAAYLKIPMRCSQPSAPRVSAPVPVDSAMTGTCIRTTVELSLAVRDAHIPTKFTKL